MKAVQKIFHQSRWVILLLFLFACSSQKQENPTSEPATVKTAVSSSTKSDIKHNNTKSSTTGLACHFCQQQLNADYWSIKTPHSYKRLHLCHRCKETTPTCDTCKSPSKKLTSVENQKICSSCISDHPQCSSCQRHILSRYAKFPGDQRVYCLACAQNKHRCDICGLPLPQKYRQLADKRKMCNTCFGSSVTTESQLQSVIEKAKDSLSRLGFHFSAEVMIKVVSSKKMTSLQKNYRVPFHKHRRTLGLFLAHGERATIYIESMLPEGACLGVVTHELVHSWQWQEMSLSIDPTWIEGMADWAAYHALKENNFTKEAQEILKQQDVYGIGVRKVLAVEKEHGISNVIPILLKKFGQ